MNGKKCKMIRKYLKKFEKLETGDVRTRANFGAISKDDQGNDVFYPPQSLVYPQNHERRIYKQLKDLYKNT
jgi:hypothetical protein